MTDLFTRHPLPWRYMPDETYDWGVVHDASGELVINTCMPKLHKEFWGKFHHTSPEFKAGPPIARQLAEMIIRAAEREKKAADDEYTDRLERAGNT